MEVGIMGLAASGKTTLFSLLTGLDPTTGGGRRDVSQIGIAKVPDPRLEHCRDIFRPKKFTPAGLELWDPPGLPEGTELRYVGRKAAASGGETAVSAPSGSQARSHSGNLQEVTAIERCVGTHGYLPVSGWLRLPNERGRC